MRAACVPRRRLGARLAPARSPRTTPRVLLHLSTEPHGGVGLRSYRAGSSRISKASAIAVVNAVGPAALTWKPWAGSHHATPDSAAETNDRRTSLSDSG